MPSTASGWQPARVSDIPNPEEDSEVQSPFAGTQASVLTEKKARSKGRPWILSGIVIIGVFALAIFFAQKAIRNPLRTLQEFPVSEYYKNHTSLEGTRFKSRLKVVNQLGWKEEVGRLVVFHAGDGENPVVVLIPPEKDSLSFESGESYAAELLVGEGGLLTAGYLKRE